MEKLTVQSEFEIYEGLQELPEDIQDLMSLAVETRKNAYAPYSNFKVGAAILLANKEVVVGNNQENASFPSGLCAERVAIYHAGARFPEVRIKAIAITASSDKYVTSAPIPPCGACRQAIAEYEINQESPIPIYFMGAVGKVMKSNSLKGLLPLLFDKNNFI
ncbi:cytidine deaminase [Zhouia amylolytica]|uniref:Cytidine deaminase n=1 Tax=Zhouia amylolytica AD3 TaxID=1286632 RepID=W2UTD6_9FLAO|nr:cytidine deaminase [Zhouia amylolytica]ETN96607.1 cytidine deaminase [Zhouia amylolytica AD3]